MHLTNTQCKNVKFNPIGKGNKIFDGGGLYLQLHKNGSKYWRLKYRYNNKEKLLAIGVYPTISLKEAREKREEAKKILANNLDPALIKQQIKIEQQASSGNTFKTIACEWHQKMYDMWSKEHADNILIRLEKNIFPNIGHRSVKEITPQELLSTIRVIESRGAIDLAKRQLQICGQIFRYAVASGKIGSDPSRDLKGALKTIKTKHHSFLHEHDLPEFFQKLEHYDGFLMTKLALHLVILTFVRSNELRYAEWDEFDLTKKEWRIPAKRMKMKTPHIVPLSPQTITLLEEIKQFSGNLKHLFPNQQNPHRGVMSENTLLYALYRMGYKGKATVHGFRSTASTILNENGFLPDIIERQLAHIERNSVRAAYNHAEYLSDRHKMMCWWGEFIGKIKENNNDT